jgi:hypothetical protein
VRSTSAHENLVDLFASRFEAMVVFHDCLRRDPGEGSDHILRFCTLLQHELDELVRFLVAEDLTTSCLWNVVLIPPVVVDIIVNNLLVAVQVNVNKQLK